MSTYVHLGCKPCQAVSGSANHRDGDIFDVICHIGAIRTFMNATHGYFRVEPCDEYHMDGQSFINFALEHSGDGHELWIVDEYGYAGQTEESYIKDYRSTVRPHTSLFWRKEEAAT